MITTDAISPQIAHLCSLPVERTTVAPIAERVAPLYRSTLFEVSSPTNPKHYVLHHSHAGLRYVGSSTSQATQRFVATYRATTEGTNAAAITLLGRHYLIGEGTFRSPALARTCFIEGARSGHPDAQFSLGFSFLHGVGGPKSDKRATELFDSALSHASIDALHRYGLTLLKSDDEMEAIEFFFAAASNGNLASVRKLEERAFERGCAESAMALATLWGKGLIPGQSRHVIRHRQYLELAARLGNEAARIRLEEEGLSHRSDPVAIAKAFRTRREGPSCKEECCLHGILQTSLERGVELFHERDFVKAKLHLSIASSLSPYANFLLGLIAYEGLDGNEDPVAARTLLSVSLQGGCIQAALPLAQLLWDDGADEDTEEMIRLLKLAANSGFVTAERLLAFCYLRGFTGEQDLEEATYWALRSHEHDPFILLHVGDILVEEEDLFNPDLAFQCYQKAIEHETPESYFALAQAYLRGIGTPVDRERAIYYLSTAIRHGSQIAIPTLRELTEAEEES